MKVQYWLLGRDRVTLTMSDFRELVRRASLMDPVEPVQSVVESCPACGGVNRYYVAAPGGPVGAFFMAAKLYCPDCGSYFDPPPVKSGS